MAKTINSVVNKNSIGEHSVDNINPLDNISTMQAIIDSIADAVINISEQGQILSFNSSAREMFGYEEHEILEKSFNVLLPIAFNHAHDGFSHNFFSKDLLKRIGKGQELTAITKDGAKFPILLTITPVNNHRDIIFTALIHDMTSVKLLESDNLRSLKAAEELGSRLDFALAAPNIGVWDYNINHDFMSWDKRMYSLHGIDDQENISQSDHWQSSIHHNDLTLVKEQIANCILLGEELNLTFRVIWPNKSCHYIETHAKVIKDDFGQNIRLIGTNRDVTEEVNLQKLQQQALDMAEESLRLKSAFLASMSHEIRTPMNGVVGMLGLLEHSNLTKAQQHHVQLAQSSAQSLLLLINDILDFSKIESGKLDFECIDFNLCSLLSDFSQAIAIKAQEKGVELILDVGDIDNTMVLGDPNRLRQILTNLVGNAIKFTHQGEIIIRAYLLTTKEESSDHYLFKCSVTDSGIGINPDEIGKLFGSFTQLDASTTRKYGGTGLGLAIVKQLCQLMYGDIKVTSDFGQGSCFEFTLTLQHSNQNQPYMQKVDCSGCSVLIVDDNNTNLAVLDGQLTRWGAKVTKANNAYEALQLVDKHPECYFQVAILDKQMPTLDGAMLGQKLKYHRNSQSIKLIMMTSMAERGDGKYFADLGFDAYFPKPVIPLDLYNALCMVLAKNEDLTTGCSLITQHHLHSMQPHEPTVNFPSDTKLLIVEDNRINQAVLLGVLTTLGLTADVASNGKEALACLTASQKIAPYQLIIMDCQMPEMDGYQATEAIRAAMAGKHYVNVPIIAMTANAMKGDKEKCFNSGMNDYLTKPIEVKKLTNRLTRWLKPQQNEIAANTGTVRKSVIKVLSSKVANRPPVTVGDTQQTVKLKSAKASKKDESTKNQLLDWDLDGFMKRISHNKAIGKKLLTLFMEDIPLDIELLQRAIEHKQVDDVIALAHKIKGSSRNLGADKLAKTCNEIEMLTRDSQLAQAINLQPLLITNFNKFIIKIETYINNMNLQQPLNQE